MALPTPLTRRYSTPSDTEVGAERKYRVETRLAASPPAPKGATLGADLNLEAQRSRQLPNDRAFLNPLMIGICDVAVVPGIASKTIEGQ